MRAAFYTLGCKVNLYESEVVMNKFKNNGYEIVDFCDISDVYIINTCTVTNNSDSKSKKIIRQAVRKNPNAIIVVMGCFSQIEPEEVKKIDGVNIIIGSNDKSKVFELVEEYIKNKENIINVCDIMQSTFEDMELDTLQTRTRAFIKIQDGCNNYCSYCIIPFSRGNIRSKDMESVVSETNKLVANGYKEIVLTGIHTGHYGKETGKYNLTDLLNELSKIDGLKRIRISSIEMTDLDEKFLEMLKNNTKIVDHMHIPLQSGCDKTLKEMNRKYDTDFFINKINEIRSIRPDISITTDVIVGFPNETIEDFNTTVEFIKNVNFSKLHVFPFSERKGTKAASMNNKVDEKIKKERVKILMNLSEYLEIRYIEKFIGKTLEIIPEKYEDGCLIGHSSNYILVKCSGTYEEIGSIKKVFIRGVDRKKHMLVD